MRVASGLFLAGLCLSASAAALPFFPKHPRIARHRTEMGEWRLDMSTNPFSGSVVCRLRDRHGQAFYQQGAIGFRFRAGWDVSNAVYRLEEGAPISWRNDLPELVRLGTPIDTGGIDNPTRGIVWIPLSQLEGVNAITIQPRPDRTQRTFRLSGFRGLYEEAAARGCSPDSRFVQ